MRNHSSLKSFLLGIVGNVAPSISSVTHKGLGKKTVIMESGQWTMQLNKNRDLDNLIMKLTHIGYYA